MEYVQWIFLTIYLVVVVTTVITVLMENRQPAKTVTWILVLICIPFIGFIFYIFFGQDRRKMRLISRHSLDKLTEKSMLESVEQTDLHIPERCSALIHQFANQSQSMPFKNNDVEIFTNGYAYFLSLLHDIGQAKHHIHIDVYIIDDDPLGRLVADALIDKARQGVEVRLVYDDVGCWNVKTAFFNRLRRGGVDAHPFMPVRFPAFTSKVNYRNHRKITVIDGSTAYIGGMNIALRYIKGTTDHRQWRDTHMRVVGGAVYAMQCVFLVDWYFAKRVLISSSVYYPPIQKRHGGCLAQVVTSSPSAKWPDIMQGYVRIIMEARQYVYMQTPYFLPTEEVLFAMRTAALSGIDVRLMIPRKGDSRILEWASTSYVIETVDAGVKIYLYTAGFNHSKTLVCDDVLCTCGSANIDFRSFENNFEANIFIYNEEVAEEMKQIFLSDQERCEPLDKVLRRTPRPFLRRLLESIVRLLSPLL